MISFPLPTTHQMMSLFCGTALALGGLCLFLLLRVHRRSAPKPPSGALAAPPSHASQEIKLISEMMRSYIRESRNYSSYLNITREQLAKPLEQLELMSVVECLINENRTLLDASCNLQICLRNRKIGSTP